MRPLASSSTRVGYPFTPSLIALAFSVKASGSSNHIFLAKARAISSVSPPACASTAQKTTFRLSVYEA